MGLLSGKVALITGGSRGIGEAIVMKYAEDGADIAFTYVSSEEKALVVVAAAEQKGVRVKAYKSDASDYAQAESLVNEVVETFGKIDILINNAGITKDTLMLRMSEEQWDQVEQMNPLIVSIAAALDTDNIESPIRRSPLDGIDDVKALSDETRRHLLDKMQEYLFEPTTMTLHLCTRLFRMIKRGYISRDPRLLAVKRQSLGISNFAGSKISDLPWLDSYAKCMRVEGETGTGKPHEVRNALRLIPNPIIHTENKDCGWSHFVQITCSMYQCPMTDPWGGYC